ncbi:MAG: hypothetical protein C0467_27175 [Planctomycetaceae bacterium]|nr:hypothetical protein [Planctomycetaceae bacterium]
MSELPEWLQSLLPPGWTGWHVAVATVALAVTSAIVSIVVIGYVLSQLPADYFVNPAARGPIKRHPVVRVVLAVVRNFFGWLLIALGGVMSLPGVPGQGVLTILMGVMLVDFPGKNRAERWLLTRRGVLAGVNKIRARLGKAPLLSEVPAEN